MLDAKELEITCVLQPRHYVLTETSKKEIRSDVFLYLNNSDFNLKVA